VKSRFSRCFKEHKADLPTPSGTLRVDFQIAGSGKVTKVQTSLPGTGVSKCVEGIIRSLAFPRHVDVAVGVPLPITWDMP
jgi:hypothetical protein